MLEAILEAGYRPRVVMVEINANFELTEARSILPPQGGGGVAAVGRLHLPWHVPAGRPVPPQQILILNGVGK